MYEYLRPRPDTRSGAVGFHTGTAADFIERHRRDAARAASLGISGVRELAGDLLTRIADARTMYVAWSHLASRTSGAPCAAGMRFRDFGRSEVWSACRALVKSIGSGTYAPGTEAIVQIPKASGGYRSLVLQTLYDRVIHRAVTEILQPLLVPLMSPTSFGCRRGTGAWHALALAEALATETGRHTWVTADIADAFARVPLTRLNQALRTVLPNDSLLELLRMLCRSPLVSGLRQGSPLSPLMLGWYLHHQLDRRWVRRCPDVPLFHYVDDLLLLCRDREEAAHARAELEELLVPCGLVTRPSKDAEADLGQRETIPWLGLTIAKAGQRYRYSITPSSWHRLDTLLLACHGKPDPAHHAVHSVIRPWLRYRAPSYRPTGAALRTAKRIVRAARAVGFEETPDAHEIASLWAGDAADWERVREKLRGQTSLGSSCSELG